MPTLFKAYGGTQGRMERMERSEISHGLCTCNLHPEINPEQSSIFWLRQRWQEKVVS